MSSLLRRFFPDAPQAAVSIPAAPMGEVIRFALDAPTSRHVVVLGKFAPFDRCTVAYRPSPFWMTNCAGDSTLTLPVETQQVLIRFAADHYGLVVPLFDSTFRSALRGVPEGGVELVADSNDSGAEGNGIEGLYLAEGTDPYQLAAEAAKAVNAHLGIARLRTEKRLPAFADTFGWCTWDAFYREVSPDKIREGLESFAKGDVQPRFLILDDGWQEVIVESNAEGRLSSLLPNAKFGGDLGPTIQMAKTEFGIETFMVWHAFHGTWGGIDAPSLPAYRARRMRRHLNEDIQASAPWLNDIWGAHVTAIEPEDISRFYHDLHRLLRAQGVDGVKVDVQAQLETVAEGFGGRVRLMRHYREALEGAVQVHFQGNLINCMSLANDMLYQTATSTLTRTSDDFYPNKPKAHGRHLYSNAQSGVWFGQFVHPDWDMFQSSHPLGPFHAAGRAVSGGPVYVSDKPGAQDFDLLRKLVLPNGRIPRALYPGVPTRDTLFHDPVNEPVALKVFNHNCCGGVLGIFNCQFQPDAEVQPTLETAFSPADIEGLSGETFAVLLHGESRPVRMQRTELRAIQLGPQGHAVATVAPFLEGIAVIGYPVLFNSGGAVAAMDRPAPNDLRLVLRGPGNLLLCVDKAPATIEGGVLESFDAENGLLRVICTGAALRLQW